jgi:ubiquinone/menaquinone biosynthesis C-methylase UbiE
MIDFNVKAKYWDKDPIKIERAKAVAGAIRRLVPLSQQMTALEYGCGTGLLSFALQPYLGPITLADSSSGMLAVLEEKIAASGVGNMTPLELDLTTDPPPADRFQLVYSLMTLHHVPNTSKILRDFCTLLEPGGYLCIADLDKEDGSFHGVGFDGHSGFDHGELCQKLMLAGFTNIHFTTCYEMVKAERHYPLFLMVAEKV